MSGSTTATVSNSGSIRSASGAALVASDAGVIDGGTSSAYRLENPSNMPNRRVASANELDNTGTIRSNGNAATVAIPSPSIRVYNSGIIVNLGSGHAIDGTYLTINNAAGTIGSGGSVAIAAASLSLTNHGGITARSSSRPMPTHPSAGSRAASSTPAAAVRSPAT